MSKRNVLTRRAVTFGAIGAAAAGIANVLAPATALAADGQRVTLGADNSEESTTTIRVSASSATNDNSPVLNVVGPGAAIIAQGDGAGILAYGGSSPAVIAQGPIGVE